MIHTTIIIIYSVIVGLILFLSDWSRLNEVTVTKAILWPWVLVAIILRNIGAALRKETN